MEYMQLVSSIVAAEHQAQAVAREAREKKSSLEADIRKETEALRASYEARAKARVEKVAQQEAEYAQQNIQQLSADLDREMAEIEALYEANRDRWAEELFRRIVGEAP